MDKSYNATEILGAIIVNQKQEPSVTHLISI